MNREIKFRVWDKNSNKWLNNYIGINNHGVIVNDRDDMENLSLCYSCIVQQFTGLKDSNGQGIYEGDILQLFPSSKNLSENISSEGIFEVRWIKPSFRGYSESNKIVTYIDLDMYDSAIGCSSRFYCKVIGNIFENPELLKENS